MKYPEFIGGSDEVYSQNLNRERTINWMPIGASSRGAKTPSALYPTPGRSVHLTLANGPVRGLYHQDGRAFAVGGDTLYEIFANGTSSSLGTVQMSQDRAWMVMNGKQGHQLLTVSGGRGWIYDLVTGEFAQVTAPAFPVGVRSATFVDGYFVVAEPNTSKFWLSSSFDGLLWDGLDVGIRSTGSDNLLAVQADERDLWTFGSRSLEIWVDQGTPSFPLAPMRGTKVDIGCLAPDSIASDHGMLWLGRVGEGSPAVFEATDYSPRMVSTPAINLALERLAEAGTTLGDARGYAYANSVGRFYVLQLPTGNRTWVLNRDVGVWHELGLWNSDAGDYDRDRGDCHVQAFGFHLIGSRENGTIYRERMDLYTDAGTIVRRLRRAPHLHEEHTRMFYPYFALDVETGVGLSVADGTAGYDPQIVLRYSHDHGRTWARELPKSLGQIGEYETRVEGFTLGAGFARTFEVVVHEPVKAVILDAYLRVYPGLSASAGA